MQILVNDARGSRLRLVIPTPLLLNGFAARLLPGILTEKGVPVQRAQMERHFAALRASAKNTRDGRLWKSNRTKGNM